MRASQAVKLVDELMKSISDYAALAMEWEIEEEDDLQNFKDELIDTIAEFKGGDE